ncbi:MAG: ABC transporter permease [Firmicutes bacterium]|nr:ABC transporter permease [Bacillota bacterium]
MKLRHITWKNIKEHPSKVALLIVSLAIGVATVVILFSISRAMFIDLQDKIDEYGANMVVVPNSKTLPLTYAGVTVGGLQYESATLTEADVAKIRTIENRANINVVAPKLLGIVSIKGHKSVIAGVHFADELKIKKWWNIKSGIRPGGNRELLLGGKAAQVLGLGVGDSVDIQGESFKVAGVLSRVGTQEDELIYLDLKQAQTILNRPGEVSLVEVSAWCKNCPIADIVEQISAKLPNANVSAVRQAAEARDLVINHFILFSAILSATMVAVAILIVFTNVLSSVRERRREIGIFRAVGYRKSHILKVVLLETGVAGILAGLVGYLAGFFGASAIAPLAVGIDVGIKFDPVLAGASVGGAVLIALLASLYPAILASRLNPAEAINAL